MNILEIVLIGVGLSMDAVAVSLTNGMTYTGTSGRKALLMPVFFGAFQALMPVLGYYAGDLCGDFLEKYAGIIVLIILGVIGAKMMIDGIKAGREAEPPAQNKNLSILTLLLQAVATSIDAFAVGVGFCAVSADIFLSAALIGATTFCLSLAAIFLGKKCGDRLGDKAQIVGGAILIVIGLKAMFF